MKATAKKTELTVVESSPADRAELALKSRETEKDLRELVARSVSITAPTNADGRQECHAAYMSLRNARVAIETTGKKAREDATAFSKAVIAEEKKLVAIVDAEETRLKALRDEWDAAREAERQAMIEAERARVAALRDRIADIHLLPSRCVGLFSGHITPIMIALEATDLSTFEELTDEAVDAHRIAVDRVTELYHKAIADEAAERARIEAEAEAKAAAEAEAARVAAESERLAREREAFEAEQARVAEAARIEAEKLAEERRKIDADRAAFEAMLKATEVEKTPEAPAVDAWFEPKATEAPVYSAHLTERLDEVDAMVDAMFDPVATLDDAQAYAGENVEGHKTSIHVPELAPYTGTAVAETMTLADAANAVCGHVPHGYLVLLCMENGAAFVMLSDPQGIDVAIPDTADKTLAEQINDAVRAAWAHSDK